MRVQLLYFPGCPNAAAARELLLRVLESEGLTVRIEEIDVTSPESPERLRGWGSPTILIDDADVAGEKAPGGACCRLYRGSDALTRGVPEEQAIPAALRRARRERGSWLRSAAALPGAVLALLPTVICPACLGAYAGVASALGLGFLLSERVLPSLIALGLFAGLVSLAWSARSHRRVGPLAGGALASVAVVAGRLIWTVPGLVYAGVALFIAAAGWNLWLGRPGPAPLIQLRLSRKEGGHP